MKGEFLSISTAEKLASRERAINHLRKAIMDNAFNEEKVEEVKVYKKILKILEGKR